MGYLHKDKMVQMKQKQNIIQQHKQFLRVKLVECQKILKEYRSKYVNNSNSSIINERTEHLLAIKDSINEQIQMDALQRDVAIIQQMYLFTVNFADLHSLKATMQNLGEFVDFADDQRNNQMFNKQETNIKQSEEEGKFQNAINQIMHKKVQQQQQTESGMNLDHIIAVDAESVSSDNDSDAGKKTMKNPSEMKSNQDSIDTKPPSVQ